MTPKLPIKVFSYSNADTVAALQHWRPFKLHFWALSEKEGSREEAWERKEEHKGEEQKVWEWLRGRILRAERGWELKCTSRKVTVFPVSLWSRTSACTTTTFKVGEELATHTTKASWASPPLRWPLKFWSIWPFWGPSCGARKTSGLPNRNMLLLLPCLHELLCFDAPTKQLQGSLQPFKTYSLLALTSNRICKTLWLLCSSTFSSNEMS